MKKINFVLIKEFIRSYAIYFFCMSLYIFLAVHSYIIKNYSATGAFFVVICFYLVILVKNATIRHYQAALKEHKRLIEKQFDLMDRIIKKSNVDLPDFNKEKEKNNHTPTV